MASILIFFAPSLDRPTELLAEGVDLKEAKRFCNHPATHNLTEGWFCGFTELDRTGFTNRPGITQPRSKLANIWRDPRVWNYNI